MQQWSDLPWFQENRFDEVMQAVIARSGPEITPHKENIFRAFALTPLEAVQVVILGQDPYPTPGHAQGLAFSVPNGTEPLPPSLRNIFQELYADLGVMRGPPNCDLTGWAEQGVLLLNTCLTTKPGQPGAHIGLGWEALAKQALQATARNLEGVVYVLWGSKARNAFFDAVVMEWGELQVRNRHHMISMPHPSPLSAHTGFFGSRPFSRIDMLREGVGGKNPIDWSA